MLSQSNWKTVPQLGAALENLSNSRVVLLLLFSLLDTVDAKTRLDEGPQNDEREVSGVLVPEGTGGLCH